MSRAKYDKDNDRLILIAGKEDTSVPTFTMAEWEAMTDAQKAEYDGKLFVISDDFNGMSVDDELSDTSVHPVQNKVITEEINDISDEISDMNNVLGAKNLLPSDNVTQTINNVTFTVNSDGTVKVIGTNSTSDNIYFNVNTSKISIKKGHYILSGCPTGGGSGKYVLTVAGTPGYDTGAGFELDYEEDVSKYIYIVVYAGATVSNLTFKPMLRPASIKDDTYVPYAMTNRELTDAYNSSLVLLWTNPSPSASFAAQKISLDLSNYSFVFVVSSGSVLVKVGAGSAWIVSNVSPNLRLRSVTASATGVTFGAGYQGSTQDNTNNIPIQIYGIR